MMTVIYNRGKLAYYESIRYRIIIIISKSNSKSNSKRNSKSNSKSNRRSNSKSNSISNSKSNSKSNSESNSKSNSKRNSKSNSKSNSNNSFYLLFSSNRLQVTQTSFFASNDSMVANNEKKTIGKESLAV
jgi:hypothetical protein